VQKEIMGVRKDISYQETSGWIQILIGLFGENGFLFNVGGKEC